MSTLKDKGWKTHSNALLNLENEDVPIIVINCDKGKKVIEPYVYDIMTDLSSRIGRNKKEFFMHKALKDLSWEDAKENCIENKIHHFDIDESQISKSLKNIKLKAWVMKYLRKSRDFAKNSSGTQVKKVNVFKRLAHRLNGKKVNSLD